MPRLRFLRPSTGLGLEKRGIHPPIWSFIGRFYYLRLFACLLPALISASLVSNISIEKQYPNVQYEEPETWQAFRRRFHEVYEMGLSDGPDMPF